MATKRNRGTVCSAPVATILKQKPAKRYGCTKRKPMARMGMKLEGGPLNGAVVQVYDLTCTLPITMKGQTGRYVGSQWVAA